MTVGLRRRRGSAGVRRRVRSAASAETVATIAGANLALWYSSDVYYPGVTPNEEDVTAAPNKAGTGLGDLAQASVPTRPHAQVSAGYPEWNYNQAIPQWLQTASGADITAANAYLDLIAVGRFDDAANRIMFDFISTAPLQDGLILRIDGGALVASANLTVTATSGWTPDTALHRFRVRCTPTEISLRVDEGALATGAGDAKQTNARNTFTTGAGYNGFQPLNGKTSEVVLLSGASSAQAEAISALLYSRYAGFLP